MPSIPPMRDPERAERDSERGETSVERHVAGGQEELPPIGAFGPVSIYEDKYTVQLKLELPDIDERSLYAEVRNNVLTVSGRRKFEMVDEQQNLDWNYGRFSRSFTLPNAVDSEKSIAIASYENGVLKIRLPKRSDLGPPSEVVRETQNLGSNEEVAGLARVLAHAIETFGSRANANAWLNRPSRVFGHQSPLQILTQDPAAVEEELVRI